ncbi:MAG: hypothetical protein KJ955_04805 [Nanoarchaeota archaeon]|nr:hypothetical protein [Nanoarchaeota archaeon]
MKEQKQESLDKDYWYLADTKQKIYYRRGYMDFDAAIRAGIIIQSYLGIESITPMKGRDIAKKGFKQGDIKME